jgi:hypothetical protein
LIIEGATLKVLSIPCVRYQTITITLVMINIKKAKNTKYSF